MHSFAGGIGVAATFAIVGGAAAIGLGLLYGAAGAAALSVGVSFFLGGLCAKLAHQAAVWLSGAPPQGERLRIGTFALGLGLTAYGLFATCAPTQHAEANRHKIFGEAKSLSVKFAHAAREANKHIIWPDIKVAHQNRPQP